MLLASVRNCFSLTDRRLIARRLYSSRRGTSFRLFLLAVSCHSQPLSGTTLRVSANNGTLIEAHRSIMTDGGSERGRRHLGQEEAREFDNCLFNDYQFSIDQLMEVAGLCVAQAVVRSYPASEVGVASPRVLVVCGPGNNGGDGLVAARHLLFMGYDPVIYYPKRTSKDIYKILVTQCEKLNIRFLTELPSAPDIDRDYHVIVDAVFGFSFKGAVRSPFDTVLATLVQCSTPIASVDVPSGWDVENGDPNGTGLKPDTLVSLTAPKTCSQLFTGRHHYLGLRMIPSELASKYKLDLPPYPGTDQIVRL